MYRGEKMRVPLGHNLAQLTAVSIQASIQGNCAFTDPITVHLRSTFIQALLPQNSRVTTAPTLLPFPKLLDTYVAKLHQRGTPFTVFAFWMQLQGQRPLAWNAR